MYIVEKIINTSWNFKLLEAVGSILFGFERLLDMFLQVFSEFLKGSGEVLTNFNSKKL
jgi:hypothetical protein